MQKTCTVLSITHLIAISLATLISAFVIESIIIFGLISMIIAVIAFPLSLVAKRYWLTTSTLLTLLVGAFFIICELIFFMLGGPAAAALPLCLLFLVVQAFSIFATIADLNQRGAFDGRHAKQISIKQLMIGTAIFALSLGLMQNISSEEIPFVNSSSVAIRYPYLVSLCLAMFFLSVAGLVSIWKSSKTISQSDDSRNSQNGDLQSCE